MTARRMGEAAARTNDFNYDDQPPWDTGVAPVFYEQDLEKYPRDAARIPEWLRQ